MEPGYGWRIILVRKKRLPRSDEEFNYAVLGVTTICIVCSTRWRHQIQHFEAIQPGVRN